MHEFDGRGGWGFGPLGPDFGIHGATYEFAGVPGSGTTSSAGADAVTETIAEGKHTTTIVYTEEPSDASLYQITSVDDGWGTVSITPTASSPTFAFQYDAGTQTTTVAETFEKSGSTETDTYTSEANGYALTNETVTIDNPSTSLPHGGTLAYFFSSTGAITETETFGSHSFSHTELMNPTATFTGLSTNTGSTANAITESYISDDAVTTITFDGDATSGYAVAKASTTFVPSDNATPALDVDPFARADFDFSDDTVTWISSKGVAGTPHSLTANSHITYTDLGKGGTSAGDFVGETLSGRFHSAYELFYSSTGVGGQYMEVAQGIGSASSLNLAGISTQLASLNAIQTFTT